MRREGFAYLYPHAWLVAGLRAQENLPSSTAPAGSEPTQAAGGVLRTMRWYADRVELFPLVVQASVKAPQHFLLGRGFRNDLTLRHTSISKEHAILTYAQGAWSLRDRNSTNGTWAKGIQVRSHLAPAPLSGECVPLRFGLVTCALVVHSGDIYDALAPRRGG